MADIQIAVIDEKDTQIALAVPGIQGPAGAISSGGSANQVFYKVSGTNYDAAWTFIGNASVDAAAAIAGTKISPNFGSQAIVTTGTNTAASFIPTSNTAPTNGIYLPGANQVGVATNGTGRLFVNSTGDLGVNTGGTQGTKLHVIGGNVWSSNFYEVARFQKSSGTAVSLGFDNTAYVATIGAYSHDGTASNLSFWTYPGSGNAEERLRITSGGLVGIGASDPQRPLDVVSNASAETVTFRGASANNISTLRFNSYNASTSYASIQSRPAYFEIATAASVPLLLVPGAGTGVGIGTTSPSNQLTVGSNGVSTITLDWHGDNLPKATFSANHATGEVRIGATNNSGTYFTTLYSNNNEAVRIDSSRRLLVGTSTETNTGARLVVAANPTFTSGTNSFGLFRIATKSTVSGDEEPLGFIEFSQDNSTGNGATISATRDYGTWTSGTSMPGRLVFSTTADGASSPTERMRITSGGTIYVKDTIIGGPTNTDYGDLKIQGGYGLNTTIGSSIFIAGFQDGAAGQGAIIFSTSDAGSAATGKARINRGGELLINYTSDNGDYKLQVNSQIFATSATIATSDGRYKENVDTLNGCVNLIKLLRPVSFTWKPQQDITRTDEDGNEILVREGHNFPSGTQVGFIAQEVQEVLAKKSWLTSIIKENVRRAVIDPTGNELAPKEEFLGIAEGNLIAVLTSALQEVIERMETLEARLTAAGIA